MWKEGRSKGDTDGRIIRSVAVGKVELRRTRWEMLNGRPAGASFRAAGRVEDVSLRGIWRVGARRVGGGSPLEERYELASGRLRDI